jgi:outer membrane protein assembly factor BamA
MRGQSARTHASRFLSSNAAHSFALAWTCLLLHACASIPKHAYGVNSLEIEGVERMDAEALKVCLVTQARERAGFPLGPAGDPECGVPPFDATRLPVQLWAWPWSEWPVYDEAVFDRDLSRIQRWYRARGFYASNIASVSRKKNADERTIDLSLTVREGEPVLVESVELRGLEALEGRVRRRVQRAVSLLRGERFDETAYDDSKRAIEDVLRDSAYAKGAVSGDIRIDPAQRRARVTIDVNPGRRYRFGKVSVEGQGELPVRPIWGAAAIEEGSPFSVSQLQDAKRAIYELGPFASVDLDEKPNDQAGVVDVVIKVVPGRTFRTAVGLGMQVGADPTLVPVDLTSDSLVQWDLHLLGKVEHRNFLGGMRRISIEDRPRLIFKQRFPAASEAPELGNLLILEFRQPALFEPRTSLVVTGRWDRGPDPYGMGFSRSDLLAGAGPERNFFDGKLRLLATINTNIFVPDSSPKGEPTPLPGLKPLPSYHATYMQYSAVVDLRDDPREPRRGAYFSLAVQHAGYFLPSGWNYVRVTPDLRGYLPLPLGIVLAGRARIGIMEITSSDIEPRDDDVGFADRLRELGPLRQRLRGGGNNSVRGYAPNTLGDVVEIGNRLDSGGTRQWEASLELRAPITANFGAVLFADIGDVSRQKSFRFKYPQTTLGFGLRYKTIIGPVRLDVGFAPPGLQTIGKDERTRCSYDVAPGPEMPLQCRPFPESSFLGANGAFHFTIGEAF